MESPHVTTQRIFVPEALSAKFASDESLTLVPVHVSDVSGQGVPTQLLKAVRTSLLGTSG